MAFTNYLLRQGRSPEQANFNGNKEICSSAKAYDSHGVPSPFPLPFDLQQTDPFLETDFLYSPHEKAKQQNQPVKTNKKIPLF